ncbi:acetylornithine transaminase [Selenomonas ruminantium]|uniref:Acetylornithine aminotransferase n=1 Tax=Selenomonas ruminantium TaxID=971 RepID=A0A1H3YK07_SELRU|nr:acetylornithine transaminase [Selenomonas ruminantium]SEA11561.1 acetylornithine/N-succinyldiaminopimelate aminotransferase [Selenomonas ruminantium]
MQEQEIFAEDQQSYLPVFNRYKIVLDHGEGAEVWDINGKKYLDFLGGIAVNVLGHNNKALVQAVTEQAGKLIHCSNLYYTQPQADAAAKLVKLSGLDKAFFANSGAEANEGAIKIARKYGYNINPEKTEIISAWDSFHGRTLATLTATGQTHYHEGLGPLPAGFTYVHYNDIAELESKISDKTAAVMLETIQGEGGVHTPDGDYLKQVRELCDKHGALLILDEIQAGIGRSGKFFAYENYGIKPDIVTLAKGLAGGVPIGAFIVTDKVAAAFKPGDHGTTFGGNPLACAAANVVLDTVPKDEFLKNIQAVGKYFKDKLQELAKKYPKFIVDVRGEGLILGAELVGAEHGRDIVNDCLAKGLIINCTAGKVLRFIPPLIITTAQIDEAFAVMDEVIGKYAG